MTQGLNQRLGAGDVQLPPQIRYMGLNHIRMMVPFEVVEVLEKLLLFVLILDEGFLLN